jgi:hypothetical protein
MGLGYFSTWPPRIGRRRSVVVAMVQQFRATLAFAPGCAAPLRSHPLLLQHIFHGCSPPPRRPSRASPLPNSDIPRLRPIAHRGHSDGWTGLHPHARILYFLRSGFPPAAASTSPPLVGGRYGCTSVTATGLLSLYLRGSPKVCPKTVLSTTIFAGSVPMWGTTSTISSPCGATVGRPVKSRPTPDRRRFSQLGCNGLFRLGILPTACKPPRTRGLCARRLICPIEKIKKID